MKKGLILLSALTLSACTVAHETDMDVAAMKREMNIEARHAATGCTFARDHEAYKNCILNTYKLNHPATYNTATVQDGRPVAVINSTQQYAVAQPTSACGLKPLPSTMDGYDWAGPTTTSETKTVETVCQKKFEPQQTVIQTVEEKIPAPEPEIIFVQQEAPAAAPQPAPPVEVVVWEQPAPPQPTCPCADPNDPCPQCYDK